MDRRPVICLMGPTASGKTEVALRLADAFPVDIISVDSALVYRGMDLGTAKPDPETLRRYPHALVDIRDPEQKYSAGEFVRDAETAIDDSHRAGRIPLLVGGTMMYFRALIRGMADLPDADSELRRAIDERAGRLGWPALHDELTAIDPATAARISPNDRQRIQRALEVFELTGRRLSYWQAETTRGRSDLNFLTAALIPAPRSVLHQRIERRLARMLDAGFLDEMRRLHARPALRGSHPSMRSVGYAAYWRYLDNELSLDEARHAALVATRQLAKRQLTWLRAEPGIFSVNPLEVDAVAAISAWMQGHRGLSKMEIGTRSL